MAEIEWKIPEQMLSQELVIVGQKELRVGMPALRLGNVPAIIGADQLLTQHLFGDFPFDFSHCSAP